MTARKAKSLDTLLRQVNEMFPGRSKDSDGWIGDPLHAARASDHNPNEHGVVCAYDFTHDPSHGLDSEKLAETIRLSGDPRLGYVISNRKISNPLIGGGIWRQYTGLNPHDHHVHVSVKQDQNLYDDSREWNLSRLTPTIRVAVLPPPTLRLGAGETADIIKLRSLLATQENGFGPILDAQVRAFQKSKGILPDGVVGPQTWSALIKRNP